jgi:galactose mutarotase-like enzyme
VPSKQCSWWNFVDFLIHARGERGYAGIVLSDQPNPRTLPSRQARGGLQVLQLENALLQVTILLEAGGRIWQIRYKPRRADLLWNRPGITAARHALYTDYDDVWAGGWDELFPNDEAGRLGDLDLPDHGELWSAEWQAHPAGDGHLHGVRLVLDTPLTRFRTEKTILLDPEAACLRVRYRLTNHSAAAFPFLFKLHPAFAVTGHHRLDMPAMEVVLEPDFMGTLASAPARFPWPYAPLASGAMDLRQIPGPESGALHFFYGTGLRQGWCALTDQASKLATALRFDPEVFPCCWLFATHGGWNGLNVAVLEPATGYPFRLPEVVASGRAKWLAPGETLETEVLFAVQEGLTSVGGVGPDGRILPAE